MTARRARVRAWRAAPPAAYTREQALADLAALYAELPALACKGRCADTCTVTDGSELERTLLAEAGRPLPPRITLAEHEALIAAGRGPRCPALGALACDYGCTPRQWLTQEQGLRLLAAAEAISRRWVEAGRP